MALWTYVPSDVSVLVAGFYQVEGYVRDTFVTVSKDIVPYATRRASDGSVSRIYNQNADYAVTLSLMAESPSNDVLTKLWQLDEITNKGKFPLFIKDGSGSSFFHAATAWVVGVPPLSFSDSTSTRDWVLQVNQGVINIGGNDGPSSAAQDVANIAASALPTLEGLV